MVNEAKLVKSCVDDDEKMTTGDLMKTQLT